MARLLEFAQRHTLLAAITALLAIVAIAVEWRYRRQTAAAVSPQDAVRLINGGALVLDVRGAEPFAAGHIIDARHVPQAELAQRADSMKKYRDKPVLVYCDNGTMATTAARLLQGLGFGQVVKLAGGLAAWKQENLPVVSGADKTADKTKSSKHKG